MHLHVWQTFLHDAFIGVKEDYDSQAIDHFFIAELLYLNNIFLILPRWFVLL